MSHSTFCQVFGFFFHVKRDGRRRDCSFMPLSHFISLLSLSYLFISIYIFRIHILFYTKIFSHLSTLYLTKQKNREISPPFSSIFFSFISIISNNLSNQLYFSQFSLNSSSLFSLSLLLSSTKPKKG